MADQMHSMTSSTDFGLDSADFGRDLPASENETYTETPPDWSDPEYSEGRIRNPIQGPVEGQIQGPIDGSHPQPQSDRSREARQQRPTAATHATSARRQDAHPQAMNDAVLDPVISPPVQRNRLFEQERQRLQEEQAYIRDISSSVVHRMHHFLTGGGHRSFTRQEHREVMRIIRNMPPAHQPFQPDQLPPSMVHLGREWPIAMDASFQAADADPAETMPAFIPAVAAGEEQPCKVKVRLWDLEELLPGGQTAIRKRCSRESSGSKGEAGRGQVAGSVDSGARTGDIGDDSDRRHQAGTNSEHIGRNNTTDGRGAHSGSGEGRDSSDTMPSVATSCITSNEAVLCSEMGISFSPCGHYLAACIATKATLESTAASARQSPSGGTVYEVCIFSMQCGDDFGKRLRGTPVRAAHCLTALQFSPTSSHLLLAYGRRHLSLLRSFGSDGSTILPIHTIIEVYRVCDMSLVRVLPSAEDELNVATFHPHPGGGLVYGTKNGRVRQLKPQQPADLQSAEKSRRIVSRDRDTSSSVLSGHLSRLVSATGEANYNDDDTAEVMAAFEAQIARMQSPEMVPLTVIFNEALQRERQLWS